MKGVAVITGAGGVLCSAFAKALAKEGMRIAVLDLNLEAAQRVAQEIIADKGEAKAYKADVLSKESLELVHQEVLKDLGKCKLLINGAGGNSPKCTTANEYYTEGDESREDVLNFFNLPKEGFGFVFDLNIMGTLLPSQIFMRDMIGEEGTSVINMSSMNAFTPLTKIPAYSGAKAALSNFTQWLAVHFANKGIRVNAIAPGFFVTAQNKNLLFSEDGTPTKRSEKIISATPMGRFGEAQELLGTLLWLADEKKSGFVTGVVVPVDGGFSAYSGV